MFGIRRIYDDLLPVNRAAIHSVQQILRAQFPDLPEKDIRKIPEQLKNPVKYRFRSILYVAEAQRGQTMGFALLLHDPGLRFCYLEYISAAKKMTGRGIGGALYERLREEALALGALGIFFESLPDDPKLCRDTGILRQNRARLKFYEQYGARPIAGTKYETPVKKGDDNPPYLVFDDLGQGISLPPESAREIVRAILERKYSHLCSKRYIEKVVDSFQDPVLLRPYRYLNPQTAPPERADVLTVSIHGHPRFAYPYFSGFEDEKGSGEGTGYNLNIPLPEHLDGAAHRSALARALRRVARHKPLFLVIALGLDTAQGDPTGTWSLQPKDFLENGRLLGVLNTPILVVQEGGYDSRVLGTNARHFFTGLWAGAYGQH